MTAIPIIFARPIAESPPDAPLPRLVGLNRSHRFHDIAAGLEGWKEIVDAHNLACGIAISGPSRSDLIEHHEAARAILAGEDPHTAVDRIFTSAENQKRRELFMKVESAALSEVSDRANAWVAAHLPEIEDALTPQVTSVLDHAANVVSHLGGVYEAADLAKHPLKAVHWAELAPLAAELAEVERLASGLRPEWVVQNLVGRDWPLVGVLDDYPSAWQTKGAPWEDDDPTLQLRKLAELRPVARVRLGAHYRDHVTALAQRAASDQVKARETDRREKDGIPQSEYARELELEALSPNPDKWGSSRH